MPSAKSTEQLEAYLRVVRKNLKALCETEASEIIQELRSHALDRISESNKADMEKVLAGLGDPREVARLNVVARLAANSVPQKSPLSILQSIARLATLSARALVALIISLAGYGFAGTLLLTALAKPFAPDRIGLWSLPDPTGDLSLSLGRRSADLQGRDILGWWIVPIGFCLGLYVAYLTYRFGRQTIQSLARDRLHVDRSGLEK